MRCLKICTLFSYYNAVCGFKYLLDETIHFAVFCHYFKTTSLALLDWSVVTLVNPVVNTEKNEVIS